MECFKFMKKNSVKHIINKHKKGLVGSIFAFLSMLSLSIGCSLSLSNYTDIGSQIVNVIRKNNRTNVEGQTYWRCEPIESRTDWLGWGVKSYLTSLANPWATYGDANNNNCFFYTDASLNQTFVRNPSNGELIPVSVFASPSSRSLACFDIKLENDVPVNTKYDFYCSKSLASILGNNLEEKELIVNCGNEQRTNISFNGIVKTFGYDFINRIVENNQNYIILPYIIKTVSSEEIISYDMKKYTGQTSFYAVLKSDKYENNYYVSMIDAIYQMGGVKNQLCYKGTYIDSYVDLFGKYENINSAVQNDYLNIVERKNTNIVNTIAGAFLITASIVLLGFLLLKMRKGFWEFNFLNVFVSASFALIIFWIVGEILYRSNVQNMIFWDIGGRIFAFAFVSIVSLITILIAQYLNKNRHEEIDNLEYYSIDI